MNKLTGCHKIDSSFRHTLPGCEASGLMFHGLNANYLTMETLCSFLYKCTQDIFLMIYSNYLVPDSIILKVS